MNRAIGFSDHSGWAVAAVVSGDPRSFQFVLRRRIELCPTGLPRQAYHAVAEQGAPRSVIAGVLSSAAGLARGSINEIARQTGRLDAAAVATARAPIPAAVDRILASHPLLHAAEGELYREALSDAAAAEGLHVIRFLTRQSRSEAAAALHRPLGELDAWLAGLRTTAGKPWTRDEKDATAAALLALAVTVTE